MDIPKSDDLSQYLEISPGDIREMATLWWKGKQGPLSAFALMFKFKHVERRSLTNARTNTSLLTTNRRVRPTNPALASLANLMYRDVDSVFILVLEKKEQCIESGAQVNIQSHIHAHIQWQLSLEYELRIIMLFTLSHRTPRVSQYNNAIFEVTLSCLPSTSLPFTPDLKSWRKKI